MTKPRIRGIGVDAVSIDRMDTRRIRDHVLSRMFHPSEVEQANSMEQGRAQFLASRFAAKEALVKALGTGFRGIGPSQIAVAVDETGQPHIDLSRELLEQLGLTRSIIHLSLTHEGSLALAFVVVEDNDGSL